MTGMMGVIDEIFAPHKHEIDQLIEAKLEEPYIVQNTDLEKDNPYKGYIRIILDGK